MALKRHLYEVIWQIITVTCLFWIVIQVPYDLSFVVQHDALYAGTISAALLIGAFVDIVFIIDIFLRYKSYLKCSPRGRVFVVPEHVMDSIFTKEIEAVAPDPKFTRRVFIFLIFDILAAVPVTFIFYSIDGYPIWLAVFSYLKLLRVVHLPYQTAFIMDWMEQKNLIVNAGFQRLFIFGFVFAIACHLAGCYYFALGWNNVFDEMPSWVEIHRLVETTSNGTTHYVDGVQPFDAYVRAVYWATITMVTTGLGDITAASGSLSETLYGIATMVLGFSLAALVIGNLTNLVTNLDADEDQFHKKMDHLNKYMAYRKLPLDLRGRIRAYYMYMWNSFKGVDEKQFLDDLPINLRLQVAGLRSKDLVCQISFLRRCRDSVINSIVVQLEQHVISPGECIVRAGATLDGCYWITRGEADVIHRDTHRVLETLSGKYGSHFGDPALFSLECQENSIRAKSYCEFLVLTREKFLEIIVKSCSEEEIETMKRSALASENRKAKVKKFFGLDDQGIELSKWAKMFEPKSNFREIWNGLIMFVIIYNAILIPLRIGTQTLLYKSRVSALEFIPDWLMDVLLWVNFIFLTSFFAYVHEGMTVRNRSSIFAHYRSQYSLVLALLILFPYDLIAAIAGVQVLPVCRLPKILLLLYFLGAYQNIAEALSSRRFALTNGVHRIIKIFIGVILFIHITGCMWIFMSVLTRYNAGDTLEAPLDPTNCSARNYDWVCNDNTTWVEIQHDDSYISITYLRAVYFVLVDMTTVGYGDIVPLNTLEMTFVTIITMFGGLLYPAVVGAIAALIANLDSSKTEFKNRLGVLTHYMVLKRFPLSLRGRIFRYYDYLWSRQRGVNEEKILKSLPPTLRVEVQDFVNGEILRNISFFQGIDKELTRLLLSVLKPATFLPGDCIIEAGSVGKQMFLLERGNVRVASTDDKFTFATLGSGDYFGEACLIKNETRVANVHATTYCDCFILTRKAFKKCAATYPQQKEHILVRLQEVLDKKKAQNEVILRNMAKGGKLNQIADTSYDASSVTESSWRHPDSMFRRWWDMLILAIVVYNIIMVPFHICFTVHSMVMFFPDFIFDIVLMVDVFWRATKFGFIKEGRMFNDEDEIWKNYRENGKRYRDVLSIFPFDFFVLLLLLAIPTHLQLQRIFWIVALVRIFKLFLIPRFPGLLSRLDYAFESSVFKSYAVLYKILKLCFAVFLVSHWLACGFYLVAEITGNSEENCENVPMIYVTPTETDCNGSGLPGIPYSVGFCPQYSFYCTPGIPNVDLTCGYTPNDECRWTGTWVLFQIAKGLLNQQTSSELDEYLRALNWALPTLVVVVIGDVTPTNIWDTFYVTVGILLGVIINATIIGSIANIVANLDGSVAKYREKLDKLERFLYVYQIPADLRQRTRNYLDYLWESQHGSGYAEIVEDLPATLRVEVSNFLKLGLIQSITCFADTQLSIQRDLAAQLYGRVYAQLDVIQYEGEISREMFFIEAGTVEKLAFRTKGPSRFSFRKQSLSASSSVVTPIGQAKPQASMRGDSSRKGEAHLDREAVVLGSLGPGSYFGESCLVTNERCDCSIRALDYTEVYVLEKARFQRILSRYPEQYENIKRVILRLANISASRHDSVLHNMEGGNFEGSKLWKLFGKATDASNELQKSIRKNQSMSQIVRSNSQISSKKREDSSFSVLGSKAKSDRNLEITRMARKSSLKDFFEKKVAETSLVFHPVSKMQTNWNIVSLILTLYIFTYIPYSICFYKDQRGPFVSENITDFTKFTMVCNFLIQLFFCVDVVLRSRFFAVNLQGRIISEPKEIWKNYLKSWFFVDVIASVPIAMIAYAVTGGSLTIDTFSWLGLPSLLRTLHLGKYISAWERVLHERFPRLSASFVQVGKMFVLFIMLNHAIACLWFFIHRYIEWNIHNTWAIADGLSLFNTTTGTHNVYNADLSPFFVYARAYYFSVTTLSSVGYGDIRPYTPLETTFELLVVMTAAINLAAFIGAIAMALFTTDSRGPVSFKSKLRKLAEYMEYRELPHSLQSQIFRHFNGMWNETRGVDLQEVMSDLPLPLQFELSTCIFNDVLQRIPDLAKLHIQVQRKIARQLHSLVTVVGDFVYREGDIGDEVYFIFSGHVEISSKQHDAEFVLGPGQHFGGMILQNLSHERVEAAQCVADCRLYYLKRDVLVDILEEFPEYQSVGIFSQLLESK